MTNRETVGRTLAVAAIVAFVCSLIVSVAVYWLRPIQIALRSVEQNRAVLVAAGLARPGETLSDSEVVSRFLNLEMRLADLDAASFVAADASMISAYDFRSAADDPAGTRTIEPDHDTASLGVRPLVMPVYLLESGGRLERIVLPVYGRGMWSTIYGYVALNEDLTTIADVWFHEHGETAGIGDRIQNPQWLQSWSGKHVYMEDGSVQLRIGSTSEVAPEARIDAITGATVTVVAVEAFVRYWLGEDGYGPLLAQLRSES